MQQESQFFCQRVSIVSRKILSCSKKCLCLQKERLWRKLHIVRQKRHRFGDQFGTETFGAPRWAEHWKIVASGWLGKPQTRSPTCPGQRSILSTKAAIWISSGWIAESLQWNQCPVWSAKCLLLNVAPEICKQNPRKQVPAKNVLSISFAQNKCPSVSCGSFKDHRMFFSLVLFFSFLDQSHPLVWCLKTGLGCKMSLVWKSSVTRLISALAV